jgi:para-aminobenzoate synthetase component 1
MAKPTYHYPIPNSYWIQKLCIWADASFPYFAFLNGNGYQYPESPFETRFLSGHHLLSEKEIWDSNYTHTRVGVIGYDFKNQIEKLESNNPVLLSLPETCFFKATFSLTFFDGKIGSSAPLDSSFWNQVAKIVLPESPIITAKVVPQLTIVEYIESVRKIQNHIIEGDTYECNFCQSYQGEFELWDPISAYFELNSRSPMPFSALFKAKEKWIVSASPERYLKRSANKLIAQPIKGTIRRGKTEAEDNIQYERLRTSEKEQAENLMITDLMRNDLSKLSETGSVKVDELFGIYPLPFIFQMISTISSTLRNTVEFKEIINATFPMGSMTGAPKISTMKIIDQLESFKRAWYSGAFGVIEPNGDFDFSVIIRSIIADIKHKKLYFGVGSAITYDSDPIYEYEECSLKARAILDVLSGK